MSRKPRALFICGSINQTSQLHQVAQHLHEFGHVFTPYYVDPWLDSVRRLGLAETTILGNKLRNRCIDYLKQRNLEIDLGGERGPYDLVVTCSDVVIPTNIRSAPIVAVQEGILDPDVPLLRLVRRMPHVIPRWLVGTAATGLSGAYDRFCVASSGYRDHFARMGAPFERLAVTGIPNFDDCAGYRNNDFPHHGYVLVCTSDARETLKRDDRPAFIRSAVQIAAGRPLFFKLHPNEDADRARAEIEHWAPGARVFAEGTAEHMVANCDELVTQWSTLTFVGLALGKNVHSYHRHEELKRLLPEQNGRAARNIADVCRDVFARRQVKLGHWQSEAA